jgi:hypothetical protein
VCMGDHEIERINILIKEMLSKPLHESVKYIPHVSTTEMQRLMDIFWDAAKNFPSLEYPDLGILSSLFPAALAVLEGSFSEERVKYVAEFMMRERRDRPRPKKDDV